MDHLLQFACHSCAAMPGALFLSVKTLFQLRFDLPAGKPRETPYTKSRSKSRRASIYRRLAGIADRVVVGFCLLPTRRDSIYPVGLARPRRKNPGKFHHDRSHRRQFAPRRRLRGSPCAQRVNRATVCERTSAATRGRGRKECLPPAGRHRGDRFDAAERSRCKGRHRVRHQLAHAFEQNGERLEGR